MQTTTDRPADATTSTGISSAIPSSSTSTTTTPRTSSARAATGSSGATSRRRPGTRRHRRAAALAGLALAVGLVTTACGASGPEAVERPTRPAADTTVAPTDAGRDAGGTPAPDPEADAWSPARVVRADHDLVVHEQPDPSSPTRTLPATDSFGSPLALLVTGAREGWVEVLVPGRPTGATAWLPADADVEVRTVTTEVRVDLQARTLTLFDGGEEVLSTPVATGAPDAPTPTGRFSVTDKLANQNPGGAYGPYALGLSGRSEVLTDFAGGDGQIAIHGTNDPSSIGRDVSHGCIRVPNDVVERLNALLPLGTPVVVV